MCQSSVTLGQNVFLTFPLLPPAVEKRLLGVFSAFSEDDAPKQSRQIPSGRLCRGRNAWQQVPFPPFGGFNLFPAAEIWRLFPLSFMACADLNPGCALEEQRLDVIVKLLTASACNGKHFSQAACALVSRCRLHVDIWWC